MLEKGEVYRFIHTRTSPLIIEGQPVGKNGSHEVLVENAGRRGYDVYGVIIAGGFLTLNRNEDGYIYSGGPRGVRDSSQEALNAAMDRGTAIIY